MFNKKLIDMKCGNGGGGGGNEGGGIGEWDGVGWAQSDNV